MASKCERARQEAEMAISSWLEKNHSRWIRITEISKALNIPIPAVNTALARMRALRIVERSERRKEGNGKKYPVYFYRSFSISIDGPSWMVPKPPTFASRQVVSIRFIESGKNKKKSP